jgi:diguanylate cyclase (GGDEF)-like protein
VETVTLTPDRHRTLWTRAGRPVLVALASVAAVVLIGWFDWITGPDLGLSLFYLIPIVVAAWYGSISAAVPVAFVAATSWLLADLNWNAGHQATSITLWNAFTRLVIYVSEGILIALVKKDRERLKVLALREATLARRDLTTSLLNARGFLEAANATITRARLTSLPIAAIYIDLDNFKRFNDLLGHAAGDDVLTAVGNAISTRLRAGDHAARIGGDEFAVILPGMSADEAQATAEAIVAEIRSFGSAYPELAFGATAGVVAYDSPPPDAEALLRCADDAMYRGKTRGKGQLVIELAPDSC